MLRSERTRWRARALAVLAAVVLPAAVGGTADAAPPAFVLGGGVTQPVFSYAGAVRESVWVDIGMDLDRDGVGDRVAADIIRPAEPAARGQRVPVIMDVSPYYACCGRGNEAQRKTYAPDGTPTGFPLFLDNYFVPRGYAVVLVDEVGSNRSTGCPDGGGRATVASGRAVIDWLNGRARAYRTVDGTERVSATWATGAVGMIGKSADGTIANGVAATGVAGLRTIVPVAAVSSYYDVFNADGAWFGYPQSSGPPGLLNPRQEELCAPFLDRLEELGGNNGDWNAFWRQRDYTLSADKVRASVFAVQGFGDVAVRPLQFGRWWDALAANNVPRKLWLSQAGHVDPFDLSRADYVDTLHRWFDRWLLDVPNGIDTEAPVRIEHSPGQWVDEQRWPPAGTRRETLWPGPGGVPGLGTLGPVAPAGPATESFTDDPALGMYQWASEPTTASTTRTLFTSAPLTSDVRMAGTGSATVTVASTTPRARIGVAVVDYGPATIRDHRGPGQGITTLETRSCWGESTQADSACYLDTDTATTQVDYEIVSEGWADIGHHASLEHQLPLRPGKFYSVTVQLSTQDHVVPAGHRIGLVIGGTDADWFVAPSQRPTLTVDLTGTSVSLPVAAGTLTGQRG
ncbi:Xaa-Pro dipeptidyl-peptidase [Goodfellowiella coeruleoviolacea]|uniref:X-Pro dipeptidyl-peptidase n=1 Tax=Goodfellowiella coeruleoviolacea TaxID=334858 RepID=A0AAE3GAK2_9PSEU|nr:Xaa-Pro dipeptidyl-peptidase [Goodfellowiella coeruleoviolacea]MCP2164560.1 X-Pro dipeptidyl-peptidase [Goodfellowiella coeruleoviolacea]